MLRWQRDLQEIGKHIHNAAQTFKYCNVYFVEIIIHLISCQCCDAGTVCAPSGVGQSEFAVADMVDMFVLLIPPAGGDELQVGQSQSIRSRLICPITGQIVIKTGVHFPAGFFKWFFASRSPKYV